MSAATTELANLALSHLGARRLTELDTDTSEEAKSCRLHFTRTRDALLRRHQWSFATKRAALVYASAPIAEWETAWTLPADCVRLIRICGETPDTPVNDFALEGRLVLLNAASTDTIEIVYVSNAAATTDYDALFIEAFSYLLASAVGQDIAADSGIVDSVLQKYRALSLNDATKADAREVLSGENFGPRQLAARSSLVNARRGTF